MQYGIPSLKETDSSEGGAVKEEKEDGKMNGEARKLTEGGLNEKGIIREASSILIKLCLLPLVPPNRITPMVCNDGRATKQWKTNCQLQLSTTKSSQSSYHNYIIHPTLSFLC